MPTPTDKPINKLTLKECQSAIRKLKRQIGEMEEEMGYIESGIYRNEDIIYDLKERIKKLTPKK